MGLKMISPNGTKEINIRESHEDARLLLNDHTARMDIVRMMMDVPVNHQTHLDYIRMCRMHLDSLEKQAICLVEPE